MKYTDLVVKTRSELYQALADSKREMLNLRIRAKVEQTVNVKRLRECRKDVARVMTRLNENKAG